MGSVKRAAKLALGFAVVAVVFGLFLLPLVPIKIGGTPCQQYPTLNGCGLGRETTSGTTASASVMYAYFDVGAVQLPSPYFGNLSYCLMDGNSHGMMCGYPVEPVSMFP